MGELVVIWAEKLREDDVEYGNLVRDMCQRNMVDFAFSARENVGCLLLPRNQGNFV